MGVTLYRPAAAVSQHQTGTTGPYELIGGSSLMLADELDYVLGVDTHRDEHVIAVVTAPAGAVIAATAAAASDRGYRELLAVAGRAAGVGG